MTKKQLTGHKSNYKTGIRAENKIANHYKKEGWSVKQSPGSRGSADLKCSKGSTKHFIQVKSSTTKVKPYISNAEIGRLKSTSTRNNATAVIATVAKSTGVNIKYAKTHQNVKL